MFRGGQLARNLPAAVLVVRSHVLWPVQEPAGQLRMLNLFTIPSFAAESYVIGGNESHDELGGQICVVEGRLCASDVTPPSTPGVELNLRPAVLTCEGTV